MQSHPDKSRHKSSPKESVPPNDAGAEFNDDYADRLSILHDELKKWETPEKSAINPLWGTGMRLISEFVAAVITGVGIGFIIDKIFSTTPWFMLVFSFAGLAAGFLSLYRTAKHQKPLP